MRATWIARGMLVLMISFFLWAGWYLWQHHALSGSTSFGFILFFILPFILAASSMLVETFFSGDVTRLEVLRYGWRYKLSGMWLIDYNHEKTVTKMRICQRYLARVLSLFFFGIYSVLIFVVVCGVISLLINPSPLSVSWSEVGFFIAYLAMIFLIYHALCRLFDMMKNLPPAIRYVVFWGVVYIIWSITFGAIMYFTTESNLRESLFMNIVQVAAGIAIYVVALGLVCGIGFALYKLARFVIIRLGMRYPVLHDIWDNFCPSATIRFFDI